MQQLPQERLVIAVRSCAILEANLEATVKYVRERKVFGAPIAEFQNTKFKLAEAKAYITMLRSFVDDCIARLQRGGRRLTGQGLVSLASCKAAAMASSQRATSSRTAGPPLRAACARSRH